MSTETKGKELDAIEPVGIDDSAERANVVGSHNALRGWTYIVQSAAASMPNSCWGKYGRVAVLEVHPGVKRVSMISPRARGVVRVVATWEKLNIGSTERCAFNRALARAHAMADAMNRRVV